MVLRRMSEDTNQRNREEAERYLKLRAAKTAIPKSESEADR
jgi:hypothetical protein